MALDIDVLIIGAGMSGIGFAVQLLRKYNLRSFEIVEKTDDVGGTWFANTYPGCGCDVASHFYSYSFALNPDWSEKFSRRTEIHEYFRTVAERYNLFPHIRFRQSVQMARWHENGQSWEVHILDNISGKTTTRWCRFLISAVGSLSIPSECEIPGAKSFQGQLFHSAHWDKSFDWSQKTVVVIGNGCSATQFVPILAQDAKDVIQFARQAHYLAERPNPTYSPAFKAVMRYVPGAMRLYRFYLYADMEKDFAGFDIESGAQIRQGLKAENERYVKRIAPQEYWDALIPKHEIGCKRKVMDTDYLSTLNRENVELIHNDPIDHITASDVVTRSGRHVRADAIVLATGFQVSRMLHPMEIIGEKGISLQEHWDVQHHGAAQAYFGTCVPGFKNFFTLMGPNTVTGHLSVIYTVECQINFVLRLMEPIVQGMSSHPGSPPAMGALSVQIKGSAAKRDSDWLQASLKKLVWASGCTSWALDPDTGLNIAMYPRFQFMFWLRSVFIPSQDFEYYCPSRSGRANKQFVVGGWKWIQRSLVITAITSVLLIGARKMNAIHSIKTSLLQSSQSGIELGRRIFGRAV